MLLTREFILLFLCYRLGCYIKKQEFSIWKEISVWIIFLYFNWIVTRDVFIHNFFVFPKSWHVLIEKIELIPFVETVQIFSGFWEPGAVWLQITRNIFIFIPIGLCLPLFFEKIKGWKKVCLYGLGIASTIEFLKILASSGKVNVDHIIFSIVGLIIGYWCYLLLMFMISEVEFSGGVMISPLIKVRQFIHKLTLNSHPNPWRLAIFPFSLMLILTIVLSISEYYMNTFPSTLTDEELISSSFNSDLDSFIEGKEVDGIRFLLKAYDGAVEVHVYEPDLFNRLSLPVIHLLYLPSSSTPHTITFLSEYIDDVFDAYIFIQGINTEASKVRITYLGESYEEAVEEGPYLVIYPKKVKLYLSGDAYKAGTYEQSQDLQIDFLDESGEVIESL